MLIFSTTSSSSLLASSDYCGCRFASVKTYCVRYITRRAEPLFGLLELFSLPLLLVVVVGGTQQARQQKRRSWKEGRHDAPRRPPLACRCPRCCCSRWIFLLLLVHRGWPLLLLRTHRAATQHHPLALSLESSSTPSSSIPHPPPSPPPPPPPPSAAAAGSSSPSLPSPSDLQVITAVLPPPCWPVLFPSARS